MKGSLKSNGKLIVGKTVNFYINNKLVGTRKTNFNDMVSLNYKVVSMGTLKVKAVFDGDSTYNGNSMQSKLKVPLLADLTIAKISKTNNYYKVSIKNQGNVKSEKNLMGINTDKKLIAKINVKAIQPGKTSVVNVKINSSYTKLKKLLKLILKMLLGKPIIKIILNLLFNQI